MNNLPPRNIELEESILASCILMPDQHIDLIEQLSPDDFYKTIHRQLFNSIQNLYSRSDPIDAISVRNQQPNITHEQMAKLIDAPVVINCDYSLSQLRAFSRLRKLIELGNALMKRGFSGEANKIDEHIDFAQRMALEIGAGYRRNYFRHISGIIEEVVDRCETISKSGGLTGIPTGFKDLDAFTCGFQSGDLVIIAGRPSMGKTAFATQCISNTAVKYKSAFFSLEMPSWQVGNRLLSGKSQIDSLKFRSGKFSNDDWIRIHNAAGEIYNWNLFVDDSSNLHYRDIIQRGREIKRKENSDIFWIDYLSFVQGEKDAGTVKEIESITRSLKSLAKELSIPIILICQLNRKCEERPNKRPILSDLRDSGAIEQDADVVLFLYRHSVYVKKYNEDGTHTEEYEKCKNIAEINIAKQRNGPTETVGLYWSNATTTFMDLLR